MDESRVDYNYHPVLFIVRAAGETGNKPEKKQQSRFREVYFDKSFLNRLQCIIK